MTDIVPVPAGIHSTDFPTNADRTAGTFNPKVVAWGDSTRAQSVRDREIALTAYTNAVAAYEAALASGASQDQAAASALSAFNEANRSYIEANRSEAGAASSWAAAAAAGAAAGLPSLVGKAGMTLTVNAAGNGVEWKAAGFEVGGIYVGAKKPTLGVWLDTDAVYLQSSYPALFSVLGLVPSVAPWTLRSTSTLVDIRGLAYGNGVFVAVGFASGGVAQGVSSTNGTTWTVRSVAATLGVCFGNGTFVSVGSGVAQTSTDGITWTARTIPAGAWSSVAYGNGIFVAIGPGIAASSPDGVTWTIRTMPTQNTVRLAFGDGVFVAVGGVNIARSTNGTTWSNVTLTGPSLSDVAYGGGFFVAVGIGGGYAVTSPNGSAWTPRYLPGPTSASGYSAVTYYSGRFVAVGALATGNPAFADSPDGISWMPRYMPAGGYSAILADGGMIIAAGTVMQTAPMFSYSTATQFYVPPPMGVVGLKSWMKAGD